MRFRAIGLVLTLALGLLAVPLPAEAQEAGKVPVVGFLVMSTPHPALWKAVDPFRQALRQLGYIEGQNLVMEWRFAERKPERLPALAAELAGLPVDVLVAPGTLMTLAATKATREIPIVMVHPGNPVRSGFIQSYAKPGGNVTGTCWCVPKLGGKQLQLLKEAVPSLARAAVLWDGNPGPVDILKSAQEAAASLGIELIVEETRKAEAFEAAFARIKRAGAEGLVVLSTAFLWGHRARLGELARGHRLPWTSYHPAYPEAGALMSYSPNLAALFRRAASYVDRILKGAKPADLPVEQPMKFEFVINMKTAKALGLTIPPSLLFQADTVIK
ncbi:MAG: ABC transporter substrate-binding protein [Candidatus Methylomirabilales bacterium]